MSHNSDGTPDLPFKLSGSQKKTSFALRQNAESLCLEAGINAVGFLTLTLGDYDEKSGRFIQITDADEASRRINNLARRFMPSLFVKSITVPERHKTSAIHFHLLVALRSGVDIRSGFDFAAFKTARAARSAGFVDHAAESRYIASACPELRALWALMREKLPLYGFGRAELTPIEKCAEAVAAYVSKYIEKNLFNRTAADRKKKLVRYAGFEGKQLKPNQFSWGTPAATRWRLRARMLAKLVQITEREQMSEFFGARWAFIVTKAMQNPSADAELQREFLLRDADRSHGSELRYLIEEVPRREREERLNGAEWHRQFAEREGIENIQ